MELANDVIAIACADLHLDEHAWADRPEINGDSMWAFKWIMDLAVENKLPIIAAGDSLDKQLNNAAVIGFVRWQLDRAKRLLCFVQGQHDLQDKPWFSSIDDPDDEESLTYWLGDEEVLDEDVELSGLKVQGIDWTPPDRIEEYLGHVHEDTDILVMHQVTKQFMQELGESRNYELDATKVPHAKMLVIGDFHRTRIVEVTGASGQDLVVISPGSTNMRSIDEPADKYVFLIHKNLTWSKVQIPTRPKWAGIIRKESELDEFAKNIQQVLWKLWEEAIAAGAPRHIAKPLVWVKFDSSILEAYQRIHDAVADVGHLFTAPLEGHVSFSSGRQDTELFEEQLLQQIDELGPLACLDMVVNEKEDPEAHRLLRRLLTGDSPLDILADERKAYIPD